MHHSYFDQLAYRSSLPHRIDARVKLWLALLSLVLLSLVSDARVMLVWAAGLLVLLRLAALPFWPLLRRSLIIAPFVLMSALFLPLLPGGDLWASVEFGALRIEIWQQGVQRLALVLSRSYLAIWVLLLLTSTTRFNHVLAALRSFAVPRLLLVILSFLYRYLFVLVGESLTLQRARAARQLHHPSLHQRLRLAANLVVMLFERAYLRAERIYQAMLARGFDGEVRLPSPLHMHRADWWVLLSGTLLLLALVLAPLAGTRL